MIKFINQKFDAMIYSIINNRVFFSPGLQRKITAGDTARILMTRPRLRVRVKGAMLTYSVKANGLYTFSVNVEEALA